MRTIAGAAPAPAIVQERLSYPEYRVYLVGGDPTVFRLSSSEIDYRTDTAPTIEHVAADSLPLEIRNGLLSLAEDVGLEFGAADLKTDRDTGELCFLELNNQPMFAAHDMRCGGALSRAIAEQLLS